MKLIILYKDGCVKEIPVKLVWQDIHSDYNLYYETYADEKGKGTFVEMKLITTWKVVPYYFNADAKL